MTNSQALDGARPSVRLEVEVPPDLIEALAEAVAERVARQVDDDRAATHYLTVEEAAAYLRCAKRRIYDLVSTRSLPHFKLGGRLLFSQRDIEDWLAERKVERAPAHAPSYEPYRPTRASGRAAAPSTTRLHATDGKPPPKKRRRPVPRHHSLGETRKTSAAKALGRSREQFDALTPGDYDKLWNERTQRISALPEEQKEALFEWDPSVEKLVEMPIDQIEALAAELPAQRADAEH